MRFRLAGVRCETKIEAHARRGELPHLKRVFGQCVRSHEFNSPLTLTMCENLNGSPRKPRSTWESATGLS